MPLMEPDRPPLELLLPAAEAAAPSSTQECTHCPGSPACSSSGQRTTGSSTRHSSFHNTDRPLCLVHPQLDDRPASLQPQAPLDVGFSDSTAPPLDPLSASSATIVSSQLQPRHSCQFPVPSQSLSDLHTPIPCIPLSTLPSPQPGCAMSEASSQQPIDTPPSSTTQCDSVCVSTAHRCASTSEDISVVGMHLPSCHLWQLDPAQVSTIVLPLPPQSPTSSPDPSLSDSPNLSFTTPSHVLHQPNPAPSNLSIHFQDPLAIASHPRRICSTVTASATAQPAMLSLSECLSSCRPFCTSASAQLLHLTSSARPQTAGSFQKATHGRTLRRCFSEETLQSHASPRPLRPPHQRAQSFEVSLLPSVVKTSCPRVLSDSVLPELRTALTSPGETPMHSTPEPAGLALECPPLYSTPASSGMPPVPSSSELTGYSAMLSPLLDTPATSHPTERRCESLLPANGVGHTRAPQDPQAAPDSTDPSVGLWQLKPTVATTPLCHASTALVPLGLSDGLPSPQSKLGVDTPAPWPSSAACAPAFTTPVNPTEFASSAQPSSLPQLSAESQGSSTRGPSAAGQSFIGGLNVQGAPASRDMSAQVPSAAAAASASSRAAHPANTVPPVSMAASNVSTAHNPQSLQCEGRAVFAAASQLQQADFAQAAATPAAQRPEPSSPAHTSMPEFLPTETVPSHASSPAQDLPTRPRTHPGAPTHSSQASMLALQAARTVSAPGAIATAGMYDPPDVPIVPRRASSSSLAALDQHTLDIVISFALAGNSQALLATCRRLRNSVRRVANTAAAADIDGPPVLDLEPLTAFPYLRRVEVPRERPLPTPPQPDPPTPSSTLIRSVLGIVLGMPPLVHGAPDVDIDSEHNLPDLCMPLTSPLGPLSFSIAHLTGLTRLTEIQIHCGATVESYLPLARLPDLQKLSVSGAALSAPPSLPPLPPGCDVFMYFNRSLGDGSTLARLPPLTGLRLGNQVPNPLLRAVGENHMTAGLTYLRLGHTLWPRLHHITRLTELRRIHLHTIGGRMRHLSHLTTLTYLHVHGTIDDLHRALPHLTALCKLSLSKARRLCPEDVLTIGRLPVLAALELPCAHSADMPPSIAPLSQLHALQHLSLAMPECGIAPLAALTSLTFLRLKWRKPETNEIPMRQGVVFCASGMSYALMAHYAFTSANATNTSIHGGYLDAVLAGLNIGFWSHAHTAAILVGASAAPLLVATTRALGVPRQPRQAPPLAALAALTRLEWLELKGSSAVPAAAWRSVLAPLRRLRRLDVRGTTFTHGCALRGKRKLRVLLVSPSYCVSEASLRQQGQLSEDVRIRM